MANKSHGGAMAGNFDLAFDEAADMRWRESKPAEADNIDVGPLTEEDFTVPCLKYARIRFERQV